MPEVIQAADEVQIRRPRFWQLADDVHAYCETLDMVELQLAEAQGEDRPLLVAEQTEIQQRLDQLGAELVGKVDSLAGVLRRLPRDVAEYKAERDRYAAKAAAAERGLDWLKEYTARVMREHSWKHLKTEKNTILRKGNGGVQPLEITDASLIPMDCRKATIAMPADEWQNFREHMLDIGMTLISESVEIDNKAIREAIADQCEVPGARLLPRGEHVRLS